MGQRSPRQGTAGGRARSGHHRIWRKTSTVVGERNRGDMDPSPGYGRDTDEIRTGSDRFDRHVFECQEVWDGAKATIPGTNPDAGRPKWCGHGTSGRHGLDRRFEHMNGGCSRIRRSNRIHERWGSQGRTIRWRSPAFVLRHVVDPEGTGCRHTSTSNDPIHSKPTFVVDEGSDSNLTCVSMDWERNTWVVSVETGSNRIATDTVLEHVRG